MIISKVSCQNGINTSHEMKVPIGIQPCDVGLYNIVFHNEDSIYNNLRVLAILTSFRAMEVLKYKDRSSGKTLDVSLFNIMGLYRSK